MSARPPLVSVIIPAWNAEATLGRTLLSAAAQTCKAIEIIIVDDGSSDGTGELAKRFCMTDARARLISKTNGGVASARNVAINAARAPWIAPLDADDLWHPTKLEKQLAAAAGRTDSIGFVYCPSFLIDAEDCVIGCTPDWQTEGRALQQLAYLNFVGNGSALLLSKEALASVGGYDEGLRRAGAEGSEDLLLQLQIARRYPIVGLSEHLVGYRVRPNAMSSDAQRMARSWRLVFERLQSEGAPIPPRVLRRTIAARLLRLAEASARAGQWSATIRQLAIAMRDDPVRTSAYLGYRSLRLATRAARGRRTRPAVRFAEAAPDARVVNDPDELRGFASLLDRIDHRRLRQLARSDAGASPD